MQNAGYDISLTRMKEQQERVLVVAFFEPRSVPSIAENIALLQRFSSFPISVINLADHRLDSGFLKIPPSVDLNMFEAVIIHNTVSYNVDNLRSLDQLLGLKFSQYRGVKVVFKQDEHYRFSEFADFAKEIAVDLIFSIMPPDEVPNTYGRLLPSATVRHMLTSYVTDKMRKPIDLAKERPIDIGYRGSIMPLSFGRLCYQKRRIGDDIARLLNGSGLCLDISSRWEDRIGGDAWHSFLGSCKAVLGVESGSDLVDLDGTLAEKCAAIEEQIGANDGSEAYAERYLSELAQIEGQIRYRMISPRHFEAIAAGAVQILFPGTYTGRMTAGTHYFELAEDYSNLDEAVELIQDEHKRQLMVTAAFQDVILDKQNWIETFVKELDESLVEALISKKRRREPKETASRAARNVVVLQAHEYGLDPRRDSWYAANSPSDVLIHQVGIRERSTEESLRQGPHGEIILNVPRRRWSNGCLDEFVAQAGRDSGASHALRELYFIAHALTLSDADLLLLYGMSQGPTEAAGFRAYLEYVLSSAVSLLHAFRRVEGAHTLIAINFPSLVPALIIKGVLGLPVVYEALEYWPEADPDQQEFARIFWLEFEARLVRFADHHGTVSAPLARLMSDQFGVPFTFVPNCAPLASKVSVRPDQGKSREPAEKIRFLFHGNFAPYRGIEQLVQTWSKVDPRAVLLLRGPDNAYKAKIVELARRMGLDDHRVQFPSAVSISELVSSAHTDGDVGIIPYTPTGANYANCSPNKMSQYMAAGLPILANSTNFVQQIVAASECGIVVDFNREDALVEAVARLCDGNLRDVFRRRAIDYFEHTYNWDVASKPFYAALQSALGEVNPSKLRVYDLSPSWLDGTVLNASGSRSSGESTTEVEIADIAPSNQNIRTLHSKPLSRAAESATDVTYIVVRGLWRMLPGKFRERLIKKLFEHRRN
ncbi:MAG: glycosyltransferase [Pseudolabrys sp.]|nr:glycosyltransferase [Pseudolabrys sp.]